MPGGGLSNLPASLQFHHFLLSDLVLLWALGSLGSLRGTAFVLVVMSFSAGLSIRVEEELACGQALARHVFEVLVHTFAAFLLLVTSLMCM